ncbi:TPA: YebF family protein [Klebsiella pneumoniae]
MFIKRIAFISTMTIVLLMLLALALYAVIVFYPLYNRGTQADCRDDYEQQAINIVTNDYLINRLPRWKNEVIDLGTIKPEMRFSGVTSGDGIYMVPFKAKGPSGTIERIGLVDCKNHYVEYSILN